jgi:hypothetical protein
MLDGTLDGIIICGSPAADLELECIPVIKKWLRENADLEVPAKK